MKMFIKLLAIALLGVVSVEARRSPTTAAADAKSELSGITSDRSAAARGLVYQSEADEKARAAIAQELGETCLAAGFVGTVVVDGLCNAIAQSGGAVNNFKPESKKVVAQYCCDVPGFAAAKTGKGKTVGSIVGCSAK